MSGSQSFPDDACTAVQRGKSQAMCTLRFHPNFNSLELQSLALPVEVRKPNLALVAKTVTSNSVQVKPGTYHVTARLPGGQELYNQVTIGEQEDYTIDLFLDPEETSPHESEEMNRYIIGSGVISSYALPEKMESLGAEDHPAGLRFFRGSPLHGQAVEYQAIDTQLAPARYTAAFSVSSDTEPGLVQLLQPNASPVNFLLPSQPYSRCQFLLALQPNGEYEFDAQLENLAADTLLRYAERGLIAQADTLVGIDNPALSSEALLAGKMRDPIGATVGAYSLLRLGQLDRLHDWTRNLMDKFEWLPDGVSIRAEHLARLGQHTEALQTLLQLEKRGLPFFSDGLSYAVNRLRQYVKSGERGDPLPELDRAASLLKLIKPFSNYADYRKAVTCFTGLDPNHPDDDPIGPQVDEINALDVAEYLG